MKYLVILLLLLSSCSLEKRLAKYCPLCVHPKHIDNAIIKKMLAADDTTKNAEKYMFGKL